MTHKPNLKKPSTTKSVVDRKRSLAAKKGAATRARNRELAIKTALRLHHKILAGGLIAAVLVVAIFGIKGQLDTYAATSTSGTTFVGLAGKCLDDKFSQVENRNWVWLYQCNGTSAQKWIMSGSAIKTSLGNQNYCIDDPGSSKQDGIAVWLYQCNGSKAQQWTFSGGHLINGVQDDCLTVKNGTTSNGTRLVLKRCDGSSSQNWIAKTGGVANGQPVGPVAVSGGSSSGNSGGGSTSAPSGTRYVSDQPFASNSIWNTAIGSNAQFEPSNGSRTSALGRAGTYINSNSGYSIFVNIASPSDPLATVTVQSPSGTFTHHIPSNATVSSGSDGNLDVVSGRYLYEYWQLSKHSDTSYSANSGYKTDLFGSGINTGIRAANFSTMGGLIRLKELKAGSIQHALVMAIPTYLAKSGWVWPAANQDWGANSQYSGTIPLGTLFAIPGSVNLNNLGLSGDGLELAHAMQDYGVYVGDTVGSSGASVLYAEPSVQINDGGAYNNMSNDLGKLFQQLRAVTNSSSNSVGGGGTPRKPALPAPSIAPGLDM